MSAFRASPGHQPPRLPRRIILASLPLDDRESLVEDLDAVFRARVSAHGRSAANRWYWRQAMSFLVRVGVDRIRDSFGGFSGIRDDARLALRSFRRHPAFAASFIVTLAIGTGVLTTVYAAANWVLLRPVPEVSRPDDLITIRLGSSVAPPHVSFEVSHPDYLTFRERLPLAGALAAVSPIEVDLLPPSGEPSRAAGALVSQNYFSVLGVPLAAGRGFLPDEESRVEGEVVTVISHALARRLHPSGNAVGTRIRVNGTPVLVVGVTAAGFRGATLPGAEEMWLPLSAHSVADPSATRGVTSRRGATVWRRMIGRLPDDGHVEAVRSAVNVAMENIRAEFRAHSFPASHFQMQVFEGVGLDPSVRASVRRTLSQLGLIAVLLLCLATANLANLSLIESTKRATAAAVRVALGANRTRLASAALIETALLGVAGTVAALWLAWTWSRWYQNTQLTEHGGALTGMAIDPRIGVLTMLVALVAAGVAFLRAASAPGHRSTDRLLRRTAGDTSASHRLRSVLVSVQVTLSLVLLVAAGLLGRTVINLRSIELGFHPDRLVTFALEPHLHGYESAALERLARRLETQLKDEGGFRGAGFISPTPLRSSYVTTSLYQSDDPDERPLIGAGFFVTPGFLPAIGARTLAGDSLWSADSGTVVLTRSTVDSLWPATPPSDVIGRVVPTRPNRGGLVRIAAVIEDLRLSDITRDPVPLVFSPLSQRWAGMSLTGFADATGQARALWSVRRILSAGAPELPLFDLRSARAAVDLQFADRNAMARAAMTLGGIGLVLAVVGLYAVMSAVVATRRREIGIRGALGAAPRRIVRRVLAGGLLPVLIGLPFGVAGSVAISRLLAPQLFELESLDPLAYAGAIALLVAATLAAAFLPAWRATRISPAEVLREE